MIAGQSAALLISDAARASIAATIRANDGCEVFFLGRADGSRVVEVEDFCRGNVHMVPVLRRAARGWDVAIHNHPSGDLTPSDPDLAVASELGDMGLGFFIVDNAAERVNPVVKLLPREAPPPEFDEGAVRRALGAGGPIAGNLGAEFEPREEQGRMAGLVGRALARGGVAAIEAGTGTGKSLAYLVPALLRAVEAKERVVVSTNTINLQEQLVRKDIPLLMQAWGGIREGDPPRTALMKGRTNYACLRKVDDLATVPDVAFDDERQRDEVRSLAAWARRTKEGSREELPAPPSPGAWEQVAVDGDTCTRTACKFYSDCFYFRARREAAAADLLVVNHSLLLSDLSVRRKAGFTSGAVLPPYKHVVFDEAHHLEDVASEHMGEKLTNAGLRRALGRLQGARRVSRGLLPALEQVLLRIGGERCAAAARAIEEQVLPARQDVDAKIDTAFAHAGYFLDGAGARRQEEEPGAVEGGRPRGESVTLRLKPEHRTREDWKRFAEAGKELVTALGLLSAAIVREVLRPLEALEGEELAAVQSLALEVKAIASRLGGAAGALGQFLDGEGEQRKDLVRWMERRRKREVGAEPTVTLRVAPLEVADTLAREVWPNLAGVALTSATLAVSGSFDFLSKRVGLDRLAEGRLETLRLPSPFAYERQCILGLPSDLPDPTDRRFDDAAAEALLAAADASGGRAFFLFTSYRALERAWRALERPLRERGISALKQGEASRRRLVERFRDEAPAVLFATDSFWEGVDVRGGALKLVVIHKLPFRVPSEPLQEARAEAISARGGEPFTEMTLPQAVLKLKQGFGRLVRSHADRGAILVLDRRVLTKGYGRLFIESLPPARIVRGRLAEVLCAVGEACRC